MKITLYTDPKSPYWYVYTNSNGHVSRFTSGLKRSEYPKEEALHIVRGRILAEMKAHTIGWLIDEFLPSLSGIRESTKVTYKTGLTNLANCFGSDMLVSEIKRRPHLSQFKEYLIARNKRPASVNADLRSVRSIFSRLVDFEIIEENPFVRFKPLRDVLEGRGYFTPEEITRLFNAMKEARHQDNVRLCRIILLTGRRPEEILSLDRNDIDMANLRFRPMNIKHWAKRKRWVHIHPDAIDDFTYFLEKNPYKQFPMRILKRPTLSEWFRRWRRKAKLPEGLGLKELRHTFVTIGLEQGESPWAIKDALDQSTVRLIEQHYAHTQARKSIDLGGILQDVSEE